MAALRSRLVRGRRWGFPSVAPAGLRLPMYLTHTAFLHAPRRLRPCLPFPLRPPPRLLHPPPPLIPPILPCSRRSTPRSCRCYPPGRPPLRGALPRRRHCLPDTGAASSPVLCAPAPPSPSSSRPSSSSPSPSRRKAALVCPRSYLLLRSFSPLPHLGPCGRLSHPARPFYRHQLPISPVGTKMLAIGRAGLLHAGRWQAGPRLAGRDRAVPPP